MLYVTVPSDAFVLATLASGAPKLSSSEQSWAKLVQDLLVEGYEFKAYIIAAGYNYVVLCKPLSITKES